MAFPAVASRHNTDITGASASHTVALSSSSVAGDMYVVIYRFGGTPSAINWPTGWNSLKALTPTATTEDRAGIYYKRLQTGDAEIGAASMNVTTSGGSVKGAYIVLRITGTHATSAPEVSADAEGASTTPNPASLSPSWGAEDTLWLWTGGWEGEQTDPPASNPANYSNPFGAGSGTGGAVATNTRVATAERQLNAASEDPGSWTISASDEWIAWTVAIRPGGVTEHDLGSIDLTGAGAFSVSALSLERFLGAISLAGTGDFSTSGLTIEKILGAVALAGSGNFTVNELTIGSIVEHFIEADFAGAGDLSAALLLDMLLGAADFTGSSAWEAALIAEFPIIANLTGAAAWEALGLQVELFTSASFDGNAAWTAPLSLETFLDAIALSGNAEFAVAELIIGTVQEHFIEADFTGEGDFTVRLGLQGQVNPIAFVISPLYRVIEENIGDAMPVNAKRVEIRSKPDGTASRRIRLDGSWLLAIKLDHVDTEAGCDIQVSDSSRTILTITDANTDAYLPVREEIVDSTGVGLGMYEPAVITGSQLFIDVTGAGASKSVFITVYYQ